MIDREKLAKHYKNFKVWQRILIAVIVLGMLYATYLEDVAPEWGGAYICIYSGNCNCNGGQGKTKNAYGDR